MLSTGTFLTLPSFFTEVYDYSSRQAVSGSLLQLDAMVAPSTRDCNEGTTSEGKKRVIVTKVPCVDVERSI
jgi:hypothetical protein